jgi:hypothetical protein
MVCVDGIKWNLFLDSADLCFDLHVQASNPNCAGFTMGDGIFKFGKKDTHVLVMEFQPFASASGIVDALDKQYELSNGAALICHVYQGLKPHKHADQWYVSYFVSDEIILFMIQLKMPAGLGRFIVNQGCVVQNGQIIGMSVKNSILVEDEVKCDQSGYYIPKEVIYQWKGHGESPEDEFYARINVKPTHSIATINILEHLPWMLRVFVTTFIAKPYCYQWLDDAEAEYRVGADEKLKTAKGKLYHELTIINDLK